jgi:hypothetical protein
MVLESYDYELCLFQREEKIRHYSSAVPLQKIIGMIRQATHRLGLMQTGPQNQLEGSCMLFAPKFGRTVMIDQDGMKMC